MVKGKAGTVLIVLAGIGLIVTTVIAVRQGPKAQAAKEAALKAKREETGDENAQLTTMESFKAQAMCYAPVFASAAVTLSSMVGADILKSDAIRSMQRFQKTYEEINKKLNGEEAEKLVRKATEEKIRDEDDFHKTKTYVIQFHDELIEFESTPETVLEAEAMTNRNMRVLGGEITFNEMLETFGLGKVPGGDVEGWNDYLGEIYFGYKWIDFVHRIRTLADGRKAIFIDMPFAAHPLDEEELDHGQNMDRV